PSRQPINRLERLIAVGHSGEDERVPLPGPPGELAPKQIRRVHFRHDLSLEVGPGSPVEVLVRGTGVAIVANNAVGDEVSCAGRDVDERDSHAERLDGNDPQPSVILDRLPLDAPLASDRGINSVKEAKMFAKAPPNPDAVDRPFPLPGLHDEIKSETTQ